MTALKSPLTALVLVFVGGLPGMAQTRAFAALFGPSDSTKAQTAASATAGVAGEWLESGGTEMELRRPGLRDGQELTPHVSPAVRQQAFQDAAKLGAESKLAVFLNGLEMALYSLGRRAGTRYLVAALEAPAVNDDEAGRLQQIADSAKSAKVKILLLDLSGEPGGKRTEPWQALATATGGAFGSDISQLVAAVPKPEPAAPAAATSPATAPSTPTGPAVYIRFFRTAPASARRSGSTLGAMQGWLIVEVPLRNLRFESEGKNYVARARLTEIARRKDGQIAWQTSKELAVKGPVSKLETRKTGSLFLSRQVQLPPGEYALEGTVEDLTGGTTIVAKEPLLATDAVPGLAMSGALLVRKLGRGIDVFDADDVLQYEGEAFAPMLNPTFPANVPFQLPVYFLFYPDMNGKRPMLRLDILNGGQVVGGSDLAFGENLRDDARSGRGGIAGEQKHEYPYLAKLADALFTEGAYQVRVTVKQDRDQVSATAAFRVVTGGGR